jgi:transcriptional regulator with XRE-family HTH domain
MATRFGQLLRQFRKRAGISQRQLAERADIDTSYISKLESGERVVSSRDLALELSAILNLTPEETDLWLLAAGYASPRLQQLGAPLIANLIQRSRSTFGATDESTELSERDG